MSMKDWEKEVLAESGAAERVAEIEDEMRLAAGRSIRATRRTYTRAPTTHSRRRARRSGGLPPMGRSGQTSTPSSTTRISLSTDPSADRATGLRLARQHLPAAGWAAAAAYDTRSCSSAFRSGAASLAPRRLWRACSAPLMAPSTRDRSVSGWRPS